jgi:hypothetical protein
MWYNNLISNLSDIVIFSRHNPGALYLIYTPTVSGSTLLVFEIIMLWIQLGLIVVIASIVDNEVLSLDPATVAIFYSTAIRTVSNRSSATPSFWLVGITTASMILIRSLTLDLHSESIRCFYVNFRENPMLCHNNFIQYNTNDDDWH